MRKHCFLMNPTLQQLCISIMPERLQESDMMKNTYEKYIVQSMKHPLIQMVWFIFPGSWNCQKHLKLLQDKLQIHMHIHVCNIFMHEDAPCHQAKKGQEYLRMVRFTMSEWPGNRPDLNPIENLCDYTKNKVVDI